MDHLQSANPNEYSSAEVLILSFLLTLFITGVFAFAGFIYPTHKILPNSYYRIKGPKSLTFTGKVLGIKYFQYLLLFAFWGRKGNRKKYFNGTKSGLNNFIFQTKQSEFGHVGACFAIALSSFVLLFDGYIFMAIIVSIINIIGNIYPVILQRLHRMRIEKITR